MKSTFLVGILLVLFISGCKDDDSQIDLNRLPHTARIFIESRLPGYDIVNLVEVDDKGDEINEKYIVTFSNDVMVSFSSLGFWRQIKSNSELPELLQEVIPFNGAAEVKSKYPIATIKEINFKMYGYQVVTGVGTPIAFYDIAASNKFGLDLTEETSLWPRNADHTLKEYFTESLSNRDFFFIKDEDNTESAYRFGDSDNTKFNFDKNGNWCFYQSGDKPLTDKMYEAFLPKEMRDVIEQKYKGEVERVGTIERHGNYYQAMIYQAGNQSIPILFDSAANRELEVPVEAINDFVKSYVGEPVTEITYNMVLLFDTEECIFYITGNVEGVKMLTMHTDVKMRMLQFHLNGSVIPNKILDYLPVKVKEYAEKNHADKRIIMVSNGLGGEYCIIYQDSSRIYFDKDGNVINQ